MFCRGSKEMNMPEELQNIPGVGKKLAKEFSKIGIKKISDFEGKNAEDLYLKICDENGCSVDKCVLYVCRSSIYFAENKNPDPEKLKWWDWKD